MTPPEKIIILESGPVDAMMHVRQEIERHIVLSFGAPVEYLGRRDLFPCEEEYLIAKHRDACLAALRPLDEMIVEQLLRQPAQPILVADNEKKAFPKVSARDYAIRPRCSGRDKKTTKRRAANKRARKARKGR